MFTYRGLSTGARSVEEMIKMNPLVKMIKPLKKGIVYVPLKTYTQYGDEIDGILEEIASILHPDIFPEKKLRFFTKLPEGVEKKDKNGI